MLILLAKARSIEERLARLQERRTGAAGKKSLYVCRPLVNGQEVADWAKAQGFGKTLMAADMHVTVVFSREPVDWSAAGEGSFGLKIAGGPRKVAPLGDKGAVVLKFASAKLTDRWRAFRDAGASWDFPGYQPHVTITYDGRGVDLSKVGPFKGPLIFGPERFAPVDEDWSEKVLEKARPSALALLPRVGASS